MGKAGGDKGSTRRSTRIAVQSVRCTNVADDNDESMDIDVETHQTNSHRKYDHEVNDYDSVSSSVGYFPIIN